MTPLPTALTCAPALIARQSIRNHLGQVVGYELFSRSRSAAAHMFAPEVLVLFTALSHTGTEDIFGTKLLFLAVTHETLADGHLDLVNPEKIVLEIPLLGHAASDEVRARLPILARLRAQGFGLSFHQSVLDSVYAPWLQLADYIKLDLSVLPRDQLAVRIQYARRHSSAQLIAEKVDTLQLYEAVQHQGVQLFQGSWLSRPTAVRTQLLAPAQSHVIELIGLLQQHASIDAIEMMLKKDAGLVFNLLRMTNSAGLGLRRNVHSFREAVMILGMRKLFRWAALLFTATREDGPPPSVCQTAVIRGRLMELLALEIGMDQEQADQAFVTGIFSLLDAMLSLPLAHSLALVRPPEAVSLALLQGEGPLTTLLTLAKACESGSGNAAILEQTAQRLQLTSRQINAAHLQALAWADHVTQAR